MPQYELMYLLGSQVADTEVPAISEQIQKFISDFGGKNIVETQLGKKKLAYPIKKTRNGHYVVVNFSMEANKVNDLDAKVRTQDNTIIRYLLINIDEHLERMNKDKVAAAKLNRKIPEGEGIAAAPSSPAPKQEAAMESAPVKKKEEKPAVVLELDQEALDKKIEEALSEDLTK